MLAGRKLTDFTGLFSPHDFKKKDEIIQLFQRCMNVIPLKLTTQN